MQYFLIVLYFNKLSIVINVLFLLAWDTEYVEIVLSNPVEQEALMWELLQVIEMAMTVRITMTKGNDKRQWQKAIVIVIVIAIGNRQ